MNKRNRYQAEAARRAAAAARLESRPARPARPPRPPGEDETVYTFTPAEWEEFLESGLDQEDLLEAAERGGRAAVEELLALHGIGHDHQAGI